MSANCQHFNNNNCLALNVQCANPNQLKNCAWKAHYQWLQLDPNEQTLFPLNASLKQQILTGASINWRKYALNRTGGRNMTATPFEDSLSKIITQNLGKNNVKVQTRKQEKIALGFKPIVDILIKKDGYPSTFILLKTYLGPGELRACVGNAFFTKNLLGSKHSRCYVVTLNDFSSSLKELIRISGSLFDGLYSVSGQSKVDGLIQNLSKLYS